MKKYYLDKMGIVTWQKRSTTQAQFFIQQRELFCGDEQVGLLLLELEKNSLQLTQHEEKLLQAIVKALACTLKNEKRILFSEIKIDFHFPYLIIFGKDIEKNLRLPEAFPKAQIIATHTLSQLLKNPLSKSHVWQMLKERFKLEKYSA